jgi:uncharacterized membrane protein YgcG
MRVRSKVGLILASVAFLAATVSACGDQNAFQPIAYGAKPWTPPADWAPQTQCAAGYYVTIKTCPGCTGLSYALCTGVDFNQCTCGSPFTPGAYCPNQFHCAADDFPPQGWQEFTDYSGPGWAGYNSGGGGSGSSSGGGSGSGSGSSSGAEAGTIGGE